MLLPNRAFFAAKGQAAVDERTKLNASVDQFERDRIQEVQDTPGDSTRPGGERPATWYARCEGPRPSYGVRKSKPA
jgi:hypothetical protein